MAGAVIAEAEADRTVVDGTRLGEVLRGEFLEGDQLQLMYVSIVVKSDIGPVIAQLAIGAIGVTIVAIEGIYLGNVPVTESHAVDKEALAEVAL